MGKVKKVLIVAPTSVCAVWPKEFNDYADFKYTVKVLLGDKKSRPQIGRASCRERVSLAV